MKLYFYCLTIWPKFLNYEISPIFRNCEILSAKIFKSGGVVAASKIHKYFSHNASFLQKLCTAKI